MEGTHQAIGLRGVHQPALLERLAEGGFLEKAAPGSEELMRAIEKRLRS